MLDYANPAWRPVGHKERGLNMKADYKRREIAPGVFESVATYWQRVGDEITEKYRKLLHV